MIKVKIKPWEEVYGLKHDYTVWQLSLDKEFENIIDTKEEHVHLNYYSNDVDVPIGTTYYLRAIRMLNSGIQTVTSSTIAIEADDTERTNVILEEELKVDTPSVYVDVDDIKTQDVIKLKTSAFRANNDQHAYTSYIIEDNLNNVLWSSLYNTKDLTEIEIPNVNQPYVNKSKLLFKVIHGTKLGVESKIGNIAVFFKNVNFELLTSLTNVKALQDLVLKFKKIDPNKKLGIIKIEIFYEAGSSPVKTYADINENNTVINFWLLRYGLNLRMVIHAIDNNDNIITIEKMIKVESYKNLIVPDPDFKYQKLLSNYYSTDVDNNTDFYIPNNFISYYIHNGYVAIPKLGQDTKLYGYEVNEDNKLKYTGEIKGIEIENDLDKEGMFIKRVNNDLLLISHTETINNNKQHVMLYYTHMTNDNSYKLLKKVIIENEQYGLGYTNSFIQYDNKYIYYIPYHTDTLKRIDLESLVIETITEDIPYVKPVRDKDLNNPNISPISPIMLRLEDDRILIIGGYTPNGTTFDHKTQTFEESIFWDNISFIGNELTAGNLINGDGIIIKKETRPNDDDDYQDDIYNNSDFVLVESLEEIYKAVNETEGISQTIFTTDLDEYELLTGENLDIILTNNFNKDDIRQFYIVYDKGTFRLDYKGINKITLHCLANVKKGRKKIKLIASKDQLFDPETFMHFNNFTHSVVTKDIWINVNNKEEEIELEDENIKAYRDVNTPASEAEYIYIYGKKYGYNSLQLDLEVHKDSLIRLPIESLNVGFEHIELVKENYIDGTMDINLVSINDDLFEIQLSNIVEYIDIRLTIRNKLRNSEFVTIQFKFIEDLIKGTPSKPKVIRNNVTYDSYSVLSFFDLITYNIDIGTGYNDPKFITNKPDYCSFSNGSGLNKYKLSIKKKQLFPLFITNLKDNVYSNSFVYINSVDAVPNLNITNPVNFIVSTESKVDILNDLTGYIPEINTNENDDIEIYTTLEGLSATLLNITVEDNKYLNIKVNDRLGSGSFSLTFKNKADGSIKRTTYNFAIYEEDSYPDGFVWKFEGYNDSKNNEIIYLLPGSLNTFSYTNNGNKTELGFKEDSILFDKELSTTDIDRPTLVVKQDKDIGTEDVTLSFFNNSGISITKLSKRVCVVPMVFYVKNSIIGDLPIDNYNFTVQHNQERSFFIYPKKPDGYYLTSIKIEPLEEYKDIKYYLKNIEGDQYEMVITSIIDSEEDKEFKFFVNYTYANDNGNTIETITKNNSQVFTITSKYYMEEVYINIPNNRITMYVGDTKELDIDTNTDAVRITAGESNLIEVNNEDYTITALKESQASVIIECGRPDQISKLEMIYIDILKPKDDTDFVQGYLHIVPEVIKTFPGSGQELTISTNTDTVNISVENEAIATYDSIRNMVVGKAKGNTRLKVVFKGDGIKGGTKYFDIVVFGLPKGDPDILYYDSFNHALIPTKLQFTAGYPKSILFDRSGKVVLSKYETTTTDSGDITKTHYTTFY